MNTLEDANPSNVDASNDPDSPLVRPARLSQRTHFDKPPYMFKHEFKRDVAAYQQEHKKAAQENPWWKNVGHSPVWEKLQESPVSPWLVLATFEVNGILYFLVRLNQGRDYKGGFFAQDVNRDFYSPPKLMVVSESGLQKEVDMSEIPDESHLNELFGRYALIEMVTLDNEFKTQIIDVLGIQEPVTLPSIDGKSGDAKYDGRYQGFTQVGDTTVVWGWINSPDGVSTTYRWLRDIYFYQPVNSEDRTEVAFKYSEQFLAAVDMFWTNSNAPEDLNVPSPPSDRFGSWVVGTQDGINLMSEVELHSSSNPDVPVGTYFSVMDSTEPEVTKSLFFPDDLEVQMIGSVNDHQVQILGVKDTADPSQLWVGVWDTSQKEMLAYDKLSYESIPLESEDQKIFSTAMTKDGKHVVVSFHSHHKDTIRVISVESGKPKVSDPIALPEGIKFNMDRGLRVIPGMRDSEIVVQRELGERQALYTLDLKSGEWHSHGTFETGAGAYTAAVGSQEKPGTQGINYVDAGVAAAVGAAGLFGLARRVFGGQTKSK
jgi:hypothetical protein